MSQANITVGDIENVSGEVTIAGGDVYKGFTVEQVSVLLTQITSTFQEKKFDGRCPYKRLDVFEEDDAKLFFGREKLVDKLVERVKDSRTVFITGPSGSGKSSLARAGLIPALKGGAIPKSDSWLYEIIKPGRDPLDALASAFSRLKSPELGKYFRKNFNQPDALHECAESTLSGRQDQRLVLFIDQFEEVFTQIGKDKAEPFLNLLTHAVTVENGRVIILFAMRSDFISNCAMYPELNELLNRQFIQIGAMQPDELVSAIAQPALRVGLKIDPDLIAQIINDMQGEPGALPLMQFALKDLFDSQDAKGGVIALTLADYLQHGGIHKALERHADNAFTRLNKDEQELAHTIFTGLIEIGRGTQDTRRTALFNELIPANRKAEDLNVTVKKLADARLITTDELEGIDTITISHEKLIDAWPWLKKLVNENRDVIALQNEIANDAKEWKEHSCDPSYLYTGARLINAREQMKGRKLSLSGLAQDFVQMGNVRQRRRQTILWSGVSSVILLLAFAVTVFKNQANTNANLAQRNEEIANTAQAANLEAVAQKATAQANAKEAEKQTHLANATQLYSQAQTIYDFDNSKQLTSVLLATQSLKIHPTSSAINFLLNNNYSVPFVAKTTHKYEVLKVAFSPNGRYVVSVDNYNTARVWESHTGNEISRIILDNPMFSVEFSLDGKYLLPTERINRINHFMDPFSAQEALKANNTISIWDAFTGNKIAQLTHDTGIYATSISPDGKYIVTQGFDDTVYIWETNTGKEIARMTHDGTVNSVDFSPDGKYIVSGSNDNTARVWEISTGKEVARMILDSGPGITIFSPNGKYVVTSSAPSYIRVWDLTTGKEVEYLTPDNMVLNFTFSPDSKYVAWHNLNDETIEVLGSQSGKEIQSFDTDYNVISFTFSPDSKYVVTRGRDNSVNILEIDTHIKVATMTHEGAILSVDFSPDGKYIVSGSEDNTARVWEISTGKEIARMTHDGIVNSVAFSPDSKYVISGSDDKTARVWEISTGKEVSFMEYDGWVDFVISGDFEVTITSNWDGAVLRAIETATEEKLPLQGHMVVSHDRRYGVIAEFGDTSIYIGEVSENEPYAHMTHDATVNSVAISQDGKYVASGSDDKTARVWDSATGSEVSRITHDSKVNSVSFSPDGKYVVSGSDDNTARVWEISTGKEIARMTHDGTVGSVAFSPDGNYVVTDCLDKNARVWEVKTGKEVTHMTHGGELNFVTFSSDGKNVISGDTNATVLIWAWQPDDLITNVCAALPRNLTRFEWQKYIGDVLPYQAVCENLPIEPEPTAIP